MSYIQPVPMAGGKLTLSHPGLCPLGRHVAQVKVIALPLHTRCAESRGWFSIGRAGHDPWELIPGPLFEWPYCCLRRGKDRSLKCPGSAHRAREHTGCDGGPNPKRSESGGAWGHPSASGTQPVSSLLASRKVYLLLHTTHVIPGEPLGIGTSSKNELQPQ